MHLAPLIQDLAVILAVAAVVTLIFRKIRQPVVLGYIIAGIIVGPHTPPTPFVSDLPSIRIWAELGVIFLMFSLGLEFSFRKLARVGLTAGGTAVLEVTAMNALGFTVGSLMGWPFIDSLFLGAMISISSTTIIVKALDELNLKTRRFAEMIFGILIVEDLAAILILATLSTIAATQTVSGLELIMSAGKLVLVIGCWFLAGYFMVPRLVRYVGRVGNNEMLTILSLGLCLSLVVAAGYFNYSSALGAFIMGSILAESTESKRIEELMEPLRDLFAAIFFVSVGMMIDPRILGEHWRSILIIALVLVAGKISFITSGALLMGQTIRTSIQVGFGLAQIGEFSFIIASLGLSLGVISPHLYPIAVAVSLITTFTTPYSIRLSHRVAVKLEEKLPLPVKAGLARYAAWSQQRRADAGRRTEFYQLIFRWFLSGLVVTAVFIIVSRFALPYFETLIHRSAWVAAVGWILAVLGSAPFIWAMFSLFRTNTPPNSAGVFILMNFLTLIWIGALSLAFFSAKHTLLITAGLGLLLFIVFYRQLEMSYRWFETHFLSTFEPSQKTEKNSDLLRKLAPWDAHLVRIKVHPNSDIVGRMLKESRLRSVYSMNVVAIQRGARTIVTPRADEYIYPNDELLVLGTDEQIEAARIAIQEPPGIIENARDISSYKLRNLLISDGSPLCGLSIRESNLGEKFAITVVGVERGARRIINPDSEMQLQLGDILWVVGDVELVSELQSNPAAAAQP